MNHPKPTTTSHTGMTMRYIDPPQCPACGDNQTGILRRKTDTKTDPWVFRCDSCQRMYPQTAPQSGRYSDGIHATIQIPERRQRGDPDTTTPHPATRPDLCPQFYTGWIPVRCRRQQFALIEEFAYDRDAAIANVTKNADGTYDTANPVIAYQQVKVTIVPLTERAQWNPTESTRADPRHATPDPDAHDPNRKKGDAE